jgi:hypothetical protein
MLTNGFGIIAFISVTPLIAIQALGIIYNIRLKFKKEELEKLEDLKSYISEESEVIINDSNN